MLNCSIDFSHFRQAVGRTLDSLQEGIDNSVRAAAYAGEQTAKSSTFKDQTGELRRKIQARQVRGGHLAATWMFVAEAKHARYVEEGTQAHDIWPKAGYRFKGPLRSGQTRRATGKGPHEHIVGRGLALRWKDANGEQHFARMVHHPGTPAFHFMAAGEARARSVLLLDLNACVNGLQRIWQ